MEGGSAWATALDIFSSRSGRRRAQSSAPSEPTSGVAITRTAANARAALSTVLQHASMNAVACTAKSVTGLSDVAFAAPGSYEACVWVCAETVSPASFMPSVVARIGENEPTVICTAR